LATAGFLRKSAAIFCMMTARQCQRIAPHHGNERMNGMSELITAIQGGQLHFPAAEWEALKMEDLHAARAVVGLMIGIFSIGLLLYTGVMLSIIF
jgi:hypothetical protein